MLIPLRFGWASLLACGAVLAGSAATARADGAFPDASQILLPADKPNEIIVGTNFGLLTSQDAGKTWQWVCEQEIAPCAQLYQIAPAPSDAIFAASTTGLVSLGADACQYSGSNGLTSVNVVDTFIDPTNAARMLALSVVAGDGGSAAYALFGSSDGGQSFGGAIYTAPEGASLNGVEIAKSDPMTVYLTESETAPSASTTILRASDGGTTFTPFPQAATLGAVQLRIAAVDPSDANTVYFRGKDANSGAESLVITSDGGATTRIAQQLPSGYVMTAFLRQADGTLLLTGLQLNPSGSLDCNGHEPYAGASAAPVAYRSSDGGKTFAVWAGAPRLRGLGERGGTLYGVADNFADGFAVGQSTDGGKTWKKLLQYVDIQGPQTCSEVASTCAASWAALQITFGIPAGGTKPAAKHGCSFSPASGHVGDLLFLAPLLLWLALARHRRRTTTTTRRS
jgi:hypothetical protein